MNKPLAKKLILIGLDGMIPEMCLKFAKERILPNMKRIMDKGSEACYGRRKLLGTPPTLRDKTLTKKVIRISCVEIRGGLA